MAGNVESLDIEDSELTRFEQTIKNPALLKKFESCLKNETPCDADGFVLKGILYDTLNSSKFEYVSSELQPIMNALKYLKRDKPLIFRRFMEIYNIKKVFFN